MFLGCWSAKLMASRKGGNTFLTAGLPFVTFIIGGSYMLSQVNERITVGLPRGVCCWFSVLSRDMFNDPVGTSLLRTLVVLILSRAMIPALI